MEWKPTKLRVSKLVNFNTNLDSVKYGFIQKKTYLIRVNFTNIHNNKNDGQHLILWLFNIISSDVWYRLFLINVQYIYDIN